MLSLFYLSEATCGAAVVLLSWSVCGREMLQLPHARTHADAAASYKRDR